MTGTDTTDQLATVRRNYEYRLYPRPEILRRLYGRRSARSWAEMALWCAEHDAGPGTV